MDNALVLARRIFKNVNSILKPHIFLCFFLAHCPQADGDSFWIGDKKDGAKKFADWT